MIYATVSDAINSYLASGKTWALAALSIAAILLVISALIGKATVGKMLTLALVVIIAWFVATSGGSLADDVKQDWDNRSGSMPVYERPIESPAAEVA